MDSRSDAENKQIKTSNVSKKVHTLHRTSKVKRAADRSRGKAKLADK
jgi:hypothetical protein